VFRTFQILLSVLIVQLQIIHSYNQFKTTTKMFFGGGGFPFGGMGGGFEEMGGRRGPPKEVDNNKFY